jgi:hypothetical protein
MYTGIMKWGFMPAWLLALLWPWPSGSNVRVACAICLGALWAVQATRAGKHIWEAGHTTVVPCKVKYEN